MSENLEAVTPGRVFDAMVALLTEYGEFMADKKVVDDFVARLATTDRSSSLVVRWQELLESHALAGTRNYLTAQDGYDLVIEYLETIAPDEPAVNSFLPELWYTEGNQAVGLNTADPATWYDWVRHLKEAPES